MGIRRIIRESIRNAFNESVNMGVADFKYDDELDDILDISHYVIKKVAYDLWPELGLSKEQEKQIGGIGDDFTPDGSDAFESVGTMNFYASKFPKEAVDKIVGYIKYILAEKNIKVGDVRYEKVKDKIAPQDFKKWDITDGGESLRVVRIPIVQNDSGDSGNPPDVHFSNDNATDFFGKILGFQGEGAMFRINAHELLMRIDKAKKEVAQSAKIPDRSKNVQNGVIISTVNGKEYYREKFDKVENFAKWALQRGYTGITVA